MKTEPRCEESRLTSSRGGKHIPGRGCNIRRALQREGAARRGVAQKPRLREEEGHGLQSLEGHGTDCGLLPKSNEKPLKDITQRDTYKELHSENIIVAVPQGANFRENREEVGYQLRNFLGNAGKRGANWGVDGGRGGREGDSLGYELQVVLTGPADQSDRDGGEGSNGDPNGGRTPGDQACVRIGSQVWADAMTQLNAFEQATGYTRVKLGEERNL